MNARDALELLLEDPQNVGPTDFGLNDGVNNQKMLAWLRKKQPRVVGQYNGVPIQQAGNNIFVEDREGLVYIARFKNDLIASLGTRYVTQVGVWRSGFGYEPGTARYVFWNLLFPIHGVTISDRKQTAFGYTFWEDCVNEAFKRGVSVYFADVESGEVVGIRDASEFRSRRSQIYGDTRRFLNLRIIISAQPIQGRGELRLDTPGDQNP